MKHDDDTIRKGRQAQEDASVALFKAGGMGVPVAHFDLEDDASVAEAVDQLKDMGEVPFSFYEIERGAVRYGEPAGEAAGKTIQQLPENVWGGVVLTFSGYAGDSRELWEIPEVITFCRGMLLGSIQRPDLDHAKRTLAVLMDERKYIDLETMQADKLFYHTSGGLFLVRTAFHAECWFSKGGKVMLNANVNVAIYNWLIGEGGPPA